MVSFSNIYAKPRPGHHERFYRYILDRQWQACLTTDYDASWHMPFLKMMKWIPAWSMKCVHSFRHASPYPGRGFMNVCLGIRNANGIIGQLYIRLQYIMTWHSVVPVNELIKFSIKLELKHKHTGLWWHPIPRNTNPFSNHNP